MSPFSCIGCRQFERDTGVVEHLDRRLDYAFESMKPEATDFSHLVRAEIDGDTLKIIVITLSYNRFC